MPAYFVSPDLLIPAYNSADVAPRPTAEDLVSDAAAAPGDGFYRTRAVGATLDDGGDRVVAGTSWDLTTTTTPGGGGAYLYLFGKTLDHDPATLLPRRASVDALLAFLREPSLARLEAVPRAPRSVRRLEDPGAGAGHEPIGQPHVSAPGASGGASLGTEMAEVYCMALARDLPLAALRAGSALDPALLPSPAGAGATPVRVADLLAALDGAAAPTWPVDPATGKVTRQLLFRGTGPGEDLGFYLSQFLLLDVPLGNATLVQKYVPERDAAASITPAGYLAIQEGATAPGTLNAGLAPRHVTTIRDLGALVHADPAYCLHLHAGLIAARAGLDALHLPDGTNSASFVDAGPVDYLTTLAAVSRAAIRVAWATKWQGAMRLRPENLAARVAWIETIPAADRAPALARLLADQNPAVLALVRRWNADWARGLHAAGAGDDTNGPLPDDIGSAAVQAGMAFLPLQYPEGSPTHPSFPAGHATLAGACVTVLKAFLRTHDDAGAPLPWAPAFGAPVVPTADGSALEPDPASPALTVVGELNKLASNVSLGRNMAGVHYRCDGDCGLRMGERTALSFLEAMTGAYYPAATRPLVRFRLETFAGDLVVVSHGRTDAWVPAQT